MVDTRTGAVLRTIRVANAPIAIAVDEQEGQAFVASLGIVRAFQPPRGPGTITVLDTANGTVRRTIQLSGVPCNLTVSATMRRVFVLNVGSNTVDVLDAGTGAFLHTVRLHGNPCAGAYEVPASLAVEEKTWRVFVALDNGVAEVDARAGRVRRTIALAGIPTATAIDRRRRHVFVTCFGADHAAKGSVAMLDAATGKVLRVSSVGGAPSVLAVDEQSGVVFVLETDGGLHQLWSAFSNSWPDDTLSVLSSGSGAVLRTVTTGGPRAIAIDPSINRAFIANPNQGTISVLRAS